MHEPIYCVWHYSTRRRPFGTTAAGTMIIRFLRETHVEVDLPNMRVVLCSMYTRPYNIYGRVVILSLCHGRDCTVTQEPQPPGTTTTALLQASTCLSKKILSQRSARRRVKRLRFALEHIISPLTIKMTVKMMISYHQYRYWNSNGKKGGISYV